MANNQRKSSDLSHPANEADTDEDIFLFRETTEDVYFHPLSKSVCERLLASTVDEGASFASAMQREVESGIYPMTKDMEYFGWKVTSYPISTEEAYPHLTILSELDSSDFKHCLNDMIRFDFVKRYPLESHQNFQSMFSQIQERCWYILNTPNPLAGLHFPLMSMGGCELQTIDDQNRIILRSFKSKNAQTIHRLICMVHQSEQEVYLSILNPRHCVRRIESTDEINLENNQSTILGGGEVFWDTHGHCRFSWQKVGEKEFEIRYGGTFLLADYSLKGKLGEFGELLIRWEQIIFQDTLVQGRG